MRVIIEQPVFTHADANPLELLAIFELCWDERHALLTDPLFAQEGTAPVNLWLQSLNQAQRRRAQHVLAVGPDVAVKRHAQSPSIRIAHGQPSHWLGTPPRLTIDEALRLLRTPLKLVVKDRRNERAFLLWLATPAHRQAILEAEAKGWVEFEHGGGINNLMVRVHDLRQPRDARVWIERLRLWCMFDRDSHPEDRGEPSETSNELHKLCAELNRPWPLAGHQLERRAIENYLPQGALRIWADEPETGRERKKRHARVSALFHHQVSEHMRCCFNMKKGLLGDRPSKTRKEIDALARRLGDDDLDPSFRGLPDNLREALRDGFGNLGRLFHDHEVTRPIHVAESEILPQSIFERY